MSDLQRHSQARPHRAGSQYRRHDDASGPFATVVQRQLAQEWVRLNRDAAAGVTIRRWWSMHPALAGVHRPADLVDVVDAAAPEQKDDVLIALVELAQARQHLAGRVLVQAMLPKLAGYAYRVGSRSGAALDDAFQLVLGEFWEVVAASPVARRRAKVAANLAMDTWHRLAHPHGAAEIPLAPQALVELGGSVDRIDPIADEIDSDCSLAELLVWARNRDVVSAADARLLAEVYAERDGGTYRDVAEAYRRCAAATGADPATLRQRVRRAKLRLTAAVRVAVDAAS